MENTLEQKRLEKGENQITVARAIGCGKAHYCNLENNKRDPSLKTALLLAKYFNTIVEDLFKLPSENSSSEKQ